MSIVHSHKFCLNCPTHSRLVSLYFIPGPDLTGCGLDRSWDKRWSQPCYLDSREAMEKARKKKKKKSLIRRTKTPGKGEADGHLVEGSHHSPGCKIRKSNQFALSHSLPLALKEGDDFLQGLLCSAGSFRRPVYLLSHPGLLPLATRSFCRGPVSSFFGFQPSIQR